MKASKLYISVLIFLVVSITGGCGDNFISSNKEPTDQGKQFVSEMNFEEGVYNAKIKLQPGETLHLNYGNTNLILIHSYSISNCSIITKDLRIRSSNQADNGSLPCAWKRSGNFAFEDLSIKNINSQAKIISVSLEGYTLNN